MEICFKCGVSAEDVRLFDAIYNGRIELICERCSIIENIPVIKKPDLSKLRESETEISSRMKILSEPNPLQKEETFFQEDRLKELEKNPKLEMPEKNKLDLIEYFHWEIMKNRRRKGLTQEQLAQTIGESELTIQMIEKGKPPENPEKVLRKLEQYFQIRLKKLTEKEKLKLLEKKPILLDEQGNELEKIPEEISEKPEEEISEENSQPALNEPPKDLDIKKIDPRGVTIGELRNIHEVKAKATREEMLEEKRKIEERKRILEALRERDRLKREEKQKQELLKKQRLEKEKQEQIEKQKQESEFKEKQEFEDVDRYLGGDELLS